MAAYGAPVVAAGGRRPSAHDTGKYPPVEAEGTATCFPPIVQIPVRKFKTKVEHDAVRVTMTSPCPLTGVKSTAIPVRRLEAINVSVGGRTRQALYAMLVIGAVIGVLLGTVADDGNMGRYIIIGMIVFYILWLVLRISTVHFDAPRVSDLIATAIVDNSKVDSIVAATLRDMSRYHGVPVDASLNAVAQGSPEAYGSAGVPPTNGDKHAFLIERRAKKFVLNCVPMGSDAIKLGNGYVFLEERTGCLDIDCISEIRYAAALTRRVRWFLEGSAPRFTYARLQLLFMSFWIVVFVAYSQILDHSDGFDATPMLALLAIGQVVVFLTWLFSTTTFIRAALSNGRVSNVRVDGKDAARELTASVMAQKLGYAAAPQLIKTWTYRKAGILSCCAWRSYAFSLYNDRIEYYSNEPAGGPFPCCRRLVYKYTMALYDMDYIYASMEGILEKIVIATMYVWGIFALNTAIAGKLDGTQFVIYLVIWVALIIYYFCTRLHVIYAGNKVGVEGEGAFAGLILSPFHLIFKWPGGDPESICELVSMQAQQASLLQGSGQVVAAAVPIDVDSVKQIQDAYGDDYVVVANPVPAGAPAQAGAPQPGGHVPY